jgi:hypothetical protein
MSNSASIPTTAASGKRESNDSIFGVLNHLDLNEVEENLHEMFMCYVRSLADQPPLSDTHDSVCTTYEAIRQIIQERKLQMAGPIN